MSQASYSPSILSHCAPHKGSKKRGLMGVQLLLVAGFFSPLAAYAQDPPGIVLNGQIQLGDAMGSLTVEFQSSQGVTANALAAGNTMSTRTLGRDLETTSSQDLQGNVAAITKVKGTHANGVTAATAIAHGNAAQVEAEGASTTTSSWQKTAKGRTIEASSDLKLGASDIVVSAVQATANNFAAKITHGNSQSQIGQANGAKVVSASKVGACCTRGSISSSAVSAANSARLDGETATIFTQVGQKNEGQVTSTSHVSANSAAHVSSGASAAGNLAEIQHKWGFSRIDGTQDNSANISSVSHVELSDFDGFAISSANSIGNSTLLSNQGSDGMIDVDQSNSGDVISEANLFGSSQSQGDGQTSTSAIGNAITGYACASCGNENVQIQGNTYQMNSGNILASSHSHLGSGGMISTSASAIGNSATFVAQRGQ